MMESVKSRYRHRRSSGIGWRVPAVSRVRDCRVPYGTYPPGQGCGAALAGNSVAPRLAYPWTSTLCHAGGSSPNRRRTGTDLPRGHAAALGSGKFGYPFTSEAQRLARVLEVNIMGMVTLRTRYARNDLSKEGTLVFLASVAGQSVPRQTRLTARASGQHQLRAVLAKDLAPHDSRQRVCPGMVRTPLNERIWQAWNDQQPPAQRRSYDDWRTIRSGP